MDGTTLRLVAALCWLCLLAAAPSSAEPWIAVQSGQACYSCHSNGTGGGMRTAVGAAYALNVLSVRPLIDENAEPEFAVLGGLRFGGDARYAMRQFEADDSDGNLEFATDRVSVYAHLQLNRAVSLYLDEQLAPGGSLNREAWGRVAYRNWYLKGGKFFLPYGWRLEDDSAYVRQASGINFSTPDNGVEVGFESAALQAQLSLSNGSAGAAERDDGKLLVARGNWIGGWGQLGVNAAYNNGDSAERLMLGLTAGLNTGPLAWLLEYDRIVDSFDGQADEEQDLVLLEANWWLRRGHNLKVTAEWQQPEAGDERQRASLVWEYFPWAHTQLRAGLRAQRSDNPVFADGEEYFLQAHLYF